MIIKALSSKRKMLFVRKVAATLKDSVYALVIQTLDQLKITHLCTINKSTFTIVFPNGSEILLKGNDDPEKVKSITGITDIWIEESTELTYNDFLQLDLRLRALVPYQEIVLTFNPVSKANWCYKHFFENIIEDAVIIHTNYKDNKFLPQKYVDNLLALEKHNPAFYKIYALGEFATLDRLIFPHFKVADISSQLLNKTKVIGIDFGYSVDPTAAVEVFYDAAEKHIYITDEIYRKEMLTTQIKDALVEKGFNNYSITADCADPRTIAELRRYGLPIQAAKKGKDSVLHGITWLQGCSITIDSSCVNTIEEFNNYCWMKDKNTNEYYNVPIDTYNHCIDALRYAVEKYSTGNTVKAVSKSLLGL